MPPKSNFKWDDTLERKFLLAIIQKEGISVSAKYCDEIVQQMGIDTTGNALRQKFDKMKKEIIGVGDGGAVGGGTPTKKGGGTGYGVGTPTKKGAKVDGGEDGSVKKKSMGKQGKKRAAVVEEEDDEEGEGEGNGEGPMVKKVKVEREETAELS